MQDRIIWRWSRGAWRCREEPWQLPASSQNWLDAWARDRDVRSVIQTEPPVGQQVSYDSRKPVPVPRPAHDSHNDV